MILKPIINHKSIILVVLLFFVIPIMGQNKTNALTNALEKGTPNQVVTLINQGVALNNTEEYLYKATLNPKIDYVKQNYKLLLKKGYKLAEYEYLQAMYRAVNENNTALLIFLTTQPEWDISENQSDCYQRAYISLEDAIDTEPSALKTLIDNGLDLYSWKSEQYTFDFAKKCYTRDNQEKSRAIFKKLVSYGINLNPAHPNGETILHAAAHSASDSIVNFFKELGVDASLKNGKGKTADDIVFKRKLVQIIKTEDAKKLESILKQGIDLKEEEYLNLLVDNATKHTVLEKFKLFIQYGYTPNTNHIREYGDVELEHSLRVAIDSNAIGLMKYIFTLDKTLQHKDKLNHFYASAILSLSTLPKKNESTVQFLIDKGLDIHSKKNKEVLLGIARQSYGYEVRVETTKAQKALKHLVLLFPVDLNFQDIDGSTMLHHAARNASEKQLTFFKELGVDPTLKNKYGNTADDILNRRKTESNLIDMIPLVLLLFSIAVLVLSFSYRKKINAVFTCIIVSFVDTLSVSYLIFTILAMFMEVKETPLELMFLAFVFGALVFVPLFLLVQYLIFRMLKSKVHTEY